MAVDSPPPAGPLPPGTARTAPEDDLRAYTSVGRGTVVLILGTLVLFAASFASRVLIVHGLSVADWGDFSLALAFTGLLALLALFGLDQAAARTLSFERDPRVRRTIVRTAVAAAAGSAVIASTLAFVLAAPLASLFRAPALAPVLEMFAPSVGLTLLSLMLAALFQGHEDAAPNAIFNQMVNPLLFVGFVAVALVLHAGLPGVVLGYVAAGALTLGGLVLHALRRLPAEAALGPAPASIAAPTPPRIWTLAAAFWGVGSLAFVTAFVDTLILGVFRPAADVGLYAAAMTIARIVLVANGALTYIYLPVAARLARDGQRSLLRSTYVTGTRWSLILVTPLFLLFTVLPGPSLVTVFGSGYGAGAPVLRVLAVGAFVSVVMGPANAALAGVGATRRLLETTVAAAGANVVLSFALVPALGALGAAVAWSVARGLYPGLGLAALHRHYGISVLHPTLLRPLVATFLLSAPLYALAASRPAPPWIVVPVGLATVGLALVALVATRSVVPGDLAAARGLEGILRRPLPRLRRVLERAAYVPPAVPEAAS